MLLSIDQGAGGCQEDAIEPQNEPFAPGGSDLPAWTSANVVRNYQKTGIVVNGSVAAKVIASAVIGADPMEYIAQNGIQIGFGATAIVQERTRFRATTTRPRYHRTRLLYGLKDCVVNAAQRPRLRPA